MRIARITELLIDEYVQRGLFLVALICSMRLKPSFVVGAAEFARLVDAFPTRLLRPDETTNKTFFKSLVAPTHPENDMNEDDASGQGDLQLSLFQDRISFLARYRDVHAFFANDQKLEAAKALVGLLRSGVVPKRFQAVLLLDALSLLEGQKYHGRCFSFSG